MKKKLLKLGLLIPYALFSQVGINTNSPTETLDVNGTLKIRNTTKQPTGKLTPIFVDDNGLVVRGAIDPTKLTTQFLYNNNSSTGIVYENQAQRDTYNNGGINWVTINKNVALGNISTANDSELIIEEPGIYEITTSFNYALRAENASQNKIVTTFTLQVSDQQNPVWRDLVKRNSEDYPSVSGTVFSLDLPSTFVELKNKSKFRIIFQRTRFYNSTQYVGNTVTGIRMEEGAGTVNLILKRI